ncbi:DUF3077 domain-containing protein [Pseudomonas sp. B2M1-30]|uniref:DUF3077 domain-containing protein n=1 Tax=Pseudomonas TaxID=286 RepID=UPI0021C64DF0|nr:MULTISPECIES: DUF3077 domain-containing protein [Pseudomonas]MCU0120460.1 DUF3077 domain-containing protein [Pseudomonas sp. B2M1-30]MCU7262478.1 DUF3077 domain-containing protein [Pseudomonas koreensis]
MHDAPEEKTIGFTPFIYCSDQPLFHVSAGVPVSQALAQASDLLALAKALAEDAAFIRNTDRYVWAAHFLTAMGKAVIDDVMKAVSPRPNRMPDTTT